jgi:hypothetical protein
MMARLGNTLVAATLVWVVGWGLAGGLAYGRDVKLVVRPQKAAAEVGKYALFPPAASLTEGDAVPLYEKAVKALPGKAMGDQIQQWLKMPIEQLPTDQVEKALMQCVESFKCVAQAVKCRECKWPTWTPGTQVANLGEYRRLGSALRLWARYEIAQENYEGAVLAMRIGFGMGRHSTQVPTLVQFLTGVSINAAMWTEVQEFVQSEEAPNLYVALAALPTPFTDVEKVIESEKKAAPSEPSVRVSGKGFESRTPFDSVRVLAKRLDTDLAALQCVEAIRSYAASHAGQLPQALTEITEVPVPKDPVSGAAFRYSRTGATAVLESAMPPGGDAQDLMRYEITVKN